MATKTIYRISFLMAGEVWEVYAESVGQGAMFGFVEVEKLLFGERSKLLIDSSEERLKNEFDGVERTFIPIHAVLRIDEVEKAGRGRITDAAGKIAAFPMTVVGPGKSKPKP